MWFDWLRHHVELKTKALAPFVRVEVKVKTKDGRTFSPFSIEWDGNALVLCENEEG